MDAKERYARQLMLPEWGEKGQEALGRARVLLAGVGGLGSPIATYLTAAGVGTLGLADADKVSVSNLQRQVLYDETQVGLSKVVRAAERLRKLNSEVNIVCHDCFVDSGNIYSLLSDYDYVIDACDNFATRFLLNDCCLELGKTYIYGSICGLDGQVSVFGRPDANGRIRSYRELYDEEELLSMPAPSKGVMGVTPAVVGTVEVNQLLALCAGYGEPLIGRLWTIDLRTMASAVIEF